jgi:RNA polymerase sigma-70 factor (ECF subfamily)
MEEDFELVERFKRGDERAFDSLVNRHYQRVCNILAHSFRPASNVEDLAQEVFIKAYNALRNYRGGAAFSTWLYRIAINVGLDELRREKRRRFFSLPLKEGGEGARDGTERLTSDDRAEAAIERRELAELLEKAMRKLSQKHRIVFALREVEGFTYKEIAGVLKCSVGTVKSRLFHARLKLRRHLRPYVQ